MSLTTRDLTAAADPALEVVVPGGADRPIEGIYCCDLLSLVMGRAGENDCWITVMGNVNAVAVATLADVSCIVLAEGMDYDPAARERAAQQGLTLLRTDLPVFAAAQLIDRLRRG